MPSETFSSLCLLFVSCVLASCASPQGQPDDWKRAEISRVFDGYREELSGVAGISAEELQRLQEQEEVVVVDVRTPEERAISMLPGAVSQEEFEAQKGQLSGRKVVAYCTIGYRSGLFAKKLQQEGLEILNLEGSILSWTHAGGDLHSDGAPTKRVHVYGRSWNLAASEYEPVW